jgi:NADH-quinone oxidoreductase subunit L
LIATRFALIYRILDKKYGFDEFNDWVFARGARGLGRGLWQLGDVRLIDGLLVNGSARVVGWFAGVIRQIQSGFIYHYAFTMIIGVLLLVTLLFMQ